MKRFLPSKDKFIGYFSFLVMIICFKIIGASTTFKTGQKYKLLTYGDFIAGPEELESLISIYLRLFIGLIRQ